MKRDYLSVTALKQFAKSPNHYLAYVTDTGRKQSPAMQLGEMIHCAILEPLAFPKRYKHVPLEIDRRTNAGKAAYNELVAEANAGERKLVTFEHYEQASQIAAAVRDCTNEHVLGLYHCEVEFNAECDMRGVLFRGRIDAANDRTVYDVKTTSDASPEAFTRDAAKFDYHLQAAAYLRLTGRKEFKWIVVETSEPFNVAVYTPHPHSLDMAAAYLDDLIEAWKEWDGQPYAYPDATIELPPWHPAMRTTRQIEWL
jgi:hypothetical protein